MNNFTTHVFDPEKDNVEEYLQAILRLEKECFPPEWQYENAEEEYRDSLTNKDDIHIFLRAGEENVGYLLARPRKSVVDELSKSDSLFLGKDDSLYVETVQILPLFRRKNGLAMLFSELMNSSKGIRTFSLHARKSNGFNVKVKRLFFKTLREVRQIKNWVYANNEEYEYLEWEHLPPIDVRKNLSWMNPKVEIRDTKKYGKGVFATSNIQKGEPVMIISGYIFSIDDENNLLEEVNDRPIEISENFSIGPLSKLDFEIMPQFYINHSCSPNVGFRGQIFMVAMRDIEAEEELTWDYAMAMHSNPNSTSYFSMKCSCGKENCREYVREDDWQNPELQERYDGYFQFFIQEKINELKKHDLPKLS